MLELKPDLEKTIQRMDAFWERELIDRPVVQIPLEKPPAECIPLPASHHTSSHERWLDVDYQLALVSTELANREFLGDTIPMAFPNLGPEVFPSFYGCPLHFGDYGTSWTDPILHDWGSADQIHMDWDSIYLKKLLALTDAFFQAGKGKWLTAMPDWHPGGDCLAAFRDPQNLAIDLLEHPDEVKVLLNRIEADYFQIYDLFYDKLRAGGLPVTSWTPLVVNGKYYIPSNDFSIMISKSQYDEFFLPGIQRECQFLDRSIYHLDGPGALRHLDSILDIPELGAIQFVPGAGNEDFSRWIEVYRKIQRAGKGIQVNCFFSELDEVMQALDPHGLFLYISDCPSRELAEKALTRLEKWCAST